jgi:hypothetical protein
VYLAQKGFADEPLAKVIKTAGHYQATAWYGEF